MLRQSEENTMDEKKLLSYLQITYWQKSFDKYETSVCPMASREGSPYSVPWIFVAEIITPSTLKLDFLLNFVVTLCPNSQIVLQYLHV